MWSVSWRGLRRDIVMDIRLFRTGMVRSRNDISSLAEMVVGERRENASRRWMILSKPIRQPVGGSTDSRGVDHGCGGNAPRDHPSNVRLRRV